MLNIKPIIIGIGLWHVKYFKNAPSYNFGFCQPI